MGPFASRQVIGQQAVAPIAQQPATQLLGIPWGIIWPAKRCAGSCPASSSWNGNWDWRTTMVMQRMLGGMGYEF